MVEVAVLKAWRVVVNALADAQVASRIMTNSDLPEAARQEATRRYVRSAVRLIAVMADLRRAGVLDAIEEFLDERYRP